MKGQVARSIRGCVKRAQAWLVRERIERRLNVDRYHWLFVLGANNSGSTLLAQVLGTHPEIRSLPQEGQLLTDAFPRPDLLGVTRLWTARMDAFRWTEESDPVPALVAKMDWARLYPARPGILLEKSPPNTVRSRWLQHNFTPSRFVAIVRNAYAVCEGIRRRNGYSVEAAARHWVAANECMFEDMEHLQRCLWFRYEDFTRDSEGWLEKLRRFLELQDPFDSKAVLGVAAHSVQGITAGIRNMNEYGVARLSAEDIGIINLVAGGLMERLGYQKL